MKLKRFWTIALLALRTIVFAIFFISCKPKTPPWRGIAVHPILPAPGFTLVDAAGRKFQLKGQRGKVVLIFFGFTHCPDICPVSMAKLKKVKDDLGEGANDVRIVFITVDPDRDGGEHLQNYVEIYDRDFIGLSGSIEELNPVYKAYGIHREKDDNGNPSTNYLINHTNSIFVVDKQGNWRLNYTDSTKIEDIIHDVRLLLKE